MFLLVIDIVIVLVLVILFVLVLVVIIIVIIPPGALSIGSFGVLDSSRFKI